MDIQQNRHNKLLKVLSQLGQYTNDEGKCVFKPVPKSRNSSDLDTISSNEINQAIILFTDALNISGASISDVNLYELLEAYFLVPDFRSSFNELVNEALSYKREL